MLTSGAWVNNFLYTEHKHSFSIALLKGAKFGCLNTNTSAICETEISQTAACEWQMRPEEDHVLLEQQVETRQDSLGYVKQHETRMLGKLNQVLDN